MTYDWTLVVHYGFVAFTLFGVLFTLFVFEAVKCVAISYFFGQPLHDFKLDKTS